MTPELYLKDIADQLEAGRYDRITDGYLYPLPVYIDRSATVGRGPSDTWAMFQSLHALLRANGIMRLVPQMTSVELPRNGRFRIWADWTGEGPSGARLLFQSICFCVGQHADHKTQMIRMTSANWPQLARILRAA